MKYLLYSGVLAWFAFSTGNAAAQQGNFGDDVKFLAKHVETIILGADKTGPRVAVVAAYQGRVMTSSALGDAGSSYGWINYELVASGKFAPQISAFGGEDRFWLGPEGGQFSIFFDPGKPFEFANWRTPALIDSMAFDVISSSQQSVHFRKQASIDNHSRTHFELLIDRTIALLDTEQVETALGTKLNGLAAVGYETRNQLTNRGDRSWHKETGLLSIWILGMYKHGDHTTVVIPFKTNGKAKRGAIVNDDYFGKVPSRRLVVDEAKQVLYFAADGKRRAKIGISPQRARGVCGSWDAERSVLTIVLYNSPGEEVTDYVNSKWELQDDPYSGDVVNSYNDGPNETGGVLGPFYELETSSPALALGAGESFTHIHRTIHVEGERRELARIAEHVFGVGIDAIEAAIQLD